MKKLLFGIIGNPISHSLSPILHNYWFKKYKINAEYKLFKTEDNEIKKVIDSVKKKDIAGLNVTLPFKKSVIPFLTKIINDANETHSVNTIFLDKEDNLIGENTDVFGFQAGYLQTLSNQDKKNKKALIIGAGGVAPSIILALVKSKIDNISLVNRTYEKSLFLKRKFNMINIVEWNDFHNKINDFDIVINATSLGLLDGEEFKFKLPKINKKLIYIDTIYNPPQTKMISNFKSQKIKTFNGLNMFIYQGQKSFYFWNKINPEVDETLIKLLETKLK